MSRRRTGSGKSPRCTESGVEPVWQGATREQAGGHFRPRINTVQLGFSAGRRPRSFRPGLLGTIVATMTATLWLTTPAAAQDQALGLNLGYFAVRGEDTRIVDDVITENLNLFAFALDEFNGGSVGAEWLVGTGEFLEVGFGAGFYQQTVLSVYTDFINDDGTEIPQDFRLRVTPVTATARFFPFGRYATVQPYAGAGVGFFNWRYSEVGEFIDFNTFDVFRDRFVATGNDVGGVYLGGVRFLAGSRYSAGFELRYQVVKGVVGIDQGFLDERIDLGGLSSSFTFNVGF